MVELTAAASVSSDASELWNLPFCEYPFFFFFFVAIFPLACCSPDHFLCFFVLPALSALVLILP